jgi:hypothetical protein
MGCVARIRMYNEHENENKKTASIDRGGAKFLEELERWEKMFSYRTIGCVMRYGKLHVWNSVISFSCFPPIFK